MKEAAGADTESDDAMGGTSVARCRQGPRNEEDPCEAPIQRPSKGDHAEDDAMQFNKDQTMKLRRQMLVMPLAAILLGLPWADASAQSTPEPQGGTEGAFEAQTPRYTSFVLSYVRDDNKRENNIYIDYDKKMSSLWSFAMAETGLAKGMASFNKNTNAIDLYFGNAYYGELTATFQGAAPKDVVEFLERAKDGRGEVEPKVGVKFSWRVTSKS